MYENRMYEKIMKQLTPVCRAMIGVVAFLAGSIWQLVSDKTLDMLTFFVMAAAMFCFVNAFIDRVMECKTDFILYLALNMAVLIVGISLIIGSEDITGVRMYSLLGICVAVDWIVNTVLISREDIFKRIVMGFVTTLFHVVLVAVVFMVPVLCEALF